MTSSRAGTGTVTMPESARRDIGSQNVASRRAARNARTEPLARGAHTGHSARVSDEVEVVERERRQLMLMQERIAGFRSGGVSLGGLISDLEGLLEARVLASEQWSDDVRAAWGELESS